MDADLQAVIERALEGDGEAFEALVKRYARLVFAHVMPLLKSPEEAEEVMQDTFVKAYKYRELLREPEKFPSWLLAIARNLARDRLRRRKPVVAMAEPELEVPANSSWSPDWAMRQADWRDRLIAALDLLPERQRLALTLRYIDGLDCTEIEADLGMSPTALRGVLHRARTGLRKLLKQEEI